MDLEDHGWSSGGKKICNCIKTYSNRIKVSVIIKKKLKTIKLKCYLLTTGLLVGLNELTIVPITRVLRYVEWKYAFDTFLIVSLLWRVSREDLNLEVGKNNKVFWSFITNQSSEFILSFVINDRIIEVLISKEILVA